MLLFSVNARVIFKGGENIKFVIWTTEVVEVFWESAESQKSGEKRLQFPAYPSADMDLPSPFKHDSHHHLFKFLGDNFHQLQFSQFKIRISTPALPTLNPEDEVSDLVQPSSLWVYSLIVIKLWSTLTGIVPISLEPGRRGLLAWLALDKVKSGLHSIFQ